MRAFWPIFKRELFAFFVTPLAWVLIVVFLVVQGMHFFLLVDHFARAGRRSRGDETPLSAFFGNTVLLYLVLFVLVPPMTMRLFAEERRSGTIETLMTAPVSSAAVVLAKYAAVLTTYVAMWVPTALYLVILGAHRATSTGTRPASAYLGVLLVGAGYLSLGLCASALTRSQFLAHGVDGAGAARRSSSSASASSSRARARRCTTSARYVSVWAHMNDFASGIVDSRRLVFYGTLVVLPLFVATRAVEAWRWG